MIKMHNMKKNKLVKTISVITLACVSIVVGKIIRHLIKSADITNHIDDWEIKDSEIPIWTNDEGIPDIDIAICNE